MEALSPSQRALLRIVCWVAMVDGDFALEERELLEKLVARLLHLDGVTGVAEATVRELAMDQAQPLDLERLVAALTRADERQLAAKLAMQMVSINQGADDAERINASEKQAYRRLIDALALPESEVEQAEWAARQELAQARTLLEVLSGALERFGAWPAAQDLDPRLPMGYWL
ncbi:MAG: hypothetical protein RLZZ336_1242 [Cyanobacteriota bacterium]